MKSKFLFLLGLFLLAGLGTYAQKTTLSGYISDAASRERLIGANVFELNSQKGTITNEHGFYSLTLERKDNIVLLVSYVGYQMDTIYVDSASKELLNINLEPSVTLRTVEVTSSASQTIEQVTQMSQMEVQVKDIKRLPAILGEVDVIKALQLMPGVSSGNEGLSGLYVRGGSPDQNLILLDGVPIYNPTHILGIFSVFNADAIKNVSLIKGGFPARYGGRLSSILNINMKEGDLNTFHGEGSISNIASKIMLEGPIKKESTSFLFSARRTYVDLIFGPLLKSQSEDLEKLAANFYDLNGKIQHRINDKHSLHLSGYAGRDKFLAKGTNSTTLDKSSSEIFWQNQIAALRWNYNISNKAFANTTLSFTNYDIGINNEYKEYEGDAFRSEYVSGIKDYAIRSVLELIPTPKHYIRLGANLIHHTYTPGASTINITTDTRILDTLLGTPSLNSLEYNVFAEDDWNINARLSANVGLHFSGFQVEDTHYTSLQPRLSVRYQIMPHLAFKSSFATMAQYINLLSSETLGLPSDLWVPSTASIQPQQAWQIASGFASTIKEGWDFTLEGFYKKMGNVISYTEGASFEPDFESDWQDKVVQGTGEVYGVEAFLNKKQGKTTGWIGYTLSWNWRQFDGINGGERYPFRYDRRHDLSLVVMHQQSKRVSYAFSWVYGTGNAITIPTQRYALRPDYAELEEFTNLIEEPRERFLTSEKNGYRMSATHRLDASVSFYKQKPKFERTWVFSIYNVYSNVNPYYVYQDFDLVKREEGRSILKRVLKERGILPIIPSVAYNFKF
jgi:outer membrane cobalamin receptor